MKTFLALFALVALAASIPLQKWHKSEDDSLYYIETDNKFNWFEAWNDCARKNMSLIAIDTFFKHQQIDSLIKKLFPTSPSFWLAGHDNAIDKRYEWATSGETFSFTNWGAGQPDRLGNNEHCVLIWQNTWQWYDLPCSHKLGFICEENHLLKEKSQEVETLRKTCEITGTESNKFKNVIFYINPNRV